MIANTPPDTTQARTKVSLSLIRTKGGELNFETRVGRWNVNDRNSMEVRKSTAPFARSKVTPDRESAANQRTFGL